MITRFATSLLTLGLISGAALTAQPVQTSPRWLESFEFRGGYSSPETVNGGEVGVAHAEVSVGGRAGLGPRTTLLTGLSYGRYELDVSGSILLPDSLKQASLLVGVQHRLNDAWSLSATLRPGVYGDKLDGDAFNAPLLAFATYATDPSLAWIVGINVNAFSDNPVLPIAGVRWQFAPDWTLNVSFPRPGVTWKASDTVSWTLGARFEGGSYRITENLGTPTGTTARIANTYLDYREVRVGLSAAIAATESVTVEFEAGAMTDRKFDYFDRNYRLNGDAGVYGSISLRGRF